MKTPRRYLPDSLPGWILWGLLLLLAVGPVIIFFTGQLFYLDLVSRIMILATAAVGLNLIVGYGGMVSFGHAAYFVIGAYSVGIPAYYGFYNGFLHLGLAVGFSALFAVLTGAVSLRTRGIYFIMITLAFAQMMYFTFVSLEEYGGDDGLVILQRSRFPGIDLENDVILYYAIFAVLVLALIFAYRLVWSRFGRVIVGAMHNDRRMQSLGFDTFRYRLTCYVISGVICGIAGFFLANFSNFISPEMTDWSHSAELLLILILGGLGSMLGPVIGSFFFVLVEEWLSTFTVYWQLYFGAMLVAVVLFGRGGINGLFERWRK
ncbi:MAG: branched-chain amino acid ABC transporter permease [Gammaproteobacteria bacterium]|nr:branched-chain amino acid ABC transporter permease [Gammaproteobacteria bacterium]